MRAGASKAPVNATVVRAKRRRCDLMVDIGFDREAPGAPPSEPLEAHALLPHATEVLR